MKFLRTYSMLAEGHDGTIASGRAHVISFPLTCRFNVVCDTTFTYNTATFQIYNLSRDTRNDLYRDPLEDLTVIKEVIFSAGYINEAYPNIIIFKGNITAAYSYRQGPDWITQIEATDGGFSGDTATINLGLPGDKNGYTLKYAVQKLIDALGPSVALGLIGDSLNGFPTSNPRGISLCGSPYDVLVRLCIAQSLLSFIYQQKAYVVSQNEFQSIKGGVSRIAAETGMIGSPRLQANQVIADMIFEPKIRPLQNIELITTQNRMSGNYIVNRVVQRGTISGAVCEDLKTQVTLFRPNLDQIINAETGETIGAAA